MTLRFAVNKKGQSPQRRRDTENIKIMSFRTMLFMVRNLEGLCRQESVQDLSIIAPALFYLPASMQASHPFEATV